jgi:hypothetical protein
VDLLKVIVLGLACLAGAGMILWFLVFVWVAMRSGGRLAWRDYRLLVIGLMLFAASLSGFMIMGQRQGAASVGGG